MKALLRYHFSWDKPNRQQIDIRFEIENHQGAQLEIQLPAWRPGRYELGNFAKNILHFDVVDAQGHALPFEKIRKDTWRIETPCVHALEVRYTYYAAELNAGSTWLDEKQLYVNPVNCCVYIPERRYEACEVHLNLPESWQIACDLPRGTQPNTMLAVDFDRLADAPWIASGSLQHGQYTIDDHTFHVWFQGHSQPAWDKVLPDFKAFSEVQLKAMGPLPGKEYHFLFQILPVFHYHGVEHTLSTVCALGPAHLVFEGDGYDDLLGVASHELYHAWNVKTLRPTTMQPYDYTRENYSRLGWVYEGITTYYGDQFLIRSGVFDFERFKVTFNEKLQRHFGTYGRLNQPVADASFDTWLDGYGPGIPHRKTSIYAEGSLVAFLFDSWIREKNEDRKSLDDLMRWLLAEHRSYTREHLLEGLQLLGLEDAEARYTRCIESVPLPEDALQQALSRLGFDLKVKQHWSEAEHVLGMQLTEQAQGWLVGLVAPNSPAEDAGLRTGDVLVALNGQRIPKNPAALWKTALQAETLHVHAFCQEILRPFSLKPSASRYFQIRELVSLPELSEAQQAARKAWMNA